MGANLAPSPVYYRSAHWDILIDIDSDSYKEFVVDVDGSVKSQRPDRVYLLYNNDNTQEVDASSGPQRANDNLDPTKDEIDYWYASGPGATGDAETHNHTRVVQDSNFSCTGDYDYWLDIQIPLTAFNVGGTQLITPSTKIQSFYSTSASNTNPLQKDWMHDPSDQGGSGFVLTDPIVFGDLYSGTGGVEPISADLVIIKADSPDPVIAGNILTYTLSITNTGPSSAAGVTVTDTLPSGVSYGSATPSQGDPCSEAGSTITCTLGTLAPSATATVTINVTVDPTETGAISNKAGVTAITTDPAPGNNTDSEDTTINVVADLGISKASEPAPAQPGRALTYTLVVTNAGPSAVSGSAVSDTIPAELSGVTWSCTASAGSSCAGGTGNLLYDTVDILPSGTLTYTVTGILTASAVADVVNTATLTIPTGVTDPVPGNNSDSDSNTPERTRLTGTVTDQGTGVPIVGATVTITDSMGHVYTTTTGLGGVYTFVSTITNPLATGPATVTATADDYESDTETPTLEPGTNSQDLQLGTADLSVSKTDGQATASPGDVLTYTLAINNIGSIAATNVVITDVLPSYTTYVTDTSGVAPAVTDAITYVWALGDLTAGGNITFELSVQVAISLPYGTTDLDDYMYASTDSPEADVTNNEIQDSDTVTAQPNMTLYKSATADSVPVSANSQVTYTYQINNEGHAYSTAVVITDLLDANTTFINGSAELVVDGVAQALATTYTDATKTLVFELPDMSPGATGLLTYTVQTGSLPGGTLAITNTATVELNETDADYGNNSDQAVLPVSAGVNLVIDKAMTADPTPAEPGGYLHVTHLHAENLGGTAGTGVVVTDVVPANTTYVANTIHLDGVNLTDAVGDDAGSYISATPMISVSLGSVAPGSITVISFTIQIYDPLPAGVAGITNTAYISASEPDSIPGDNEDTAAVSVSGQPDLAIVKSDGQTDVMVGEAITYTLVYSNIGNIGVTGVVITDTVLDNLTNVVPGGGGVYDPATGIITWTISTLEVDGSHTLTVTATVSETALEGQLAANRAEITDDGANGADADLSNNTSLDTDVIYGPYVVLEKQASSPAYVGSTVTFTISYQNLGQETAYSIVITDVIPTNTIYVPGSCTPACSVGSGVITWTVSSVAAGGSGSVSFVVTVQEGAGGVLQTAPTLQVEAASGTLVITSSISSISRPWCDFAGCDSLRVYYDGSDPQNPQGPSGWRDNPRLQGTILDDSSWQVPIAPVPESYWTDPANLSASYVSYTSTAQLDPNYSFYRQSFCLPLNASDLNAELQIANDDQTNSYLNGIFVGSKRGSGSAATFDATR